ncbi:HNH endonuclease signature motif containing protein [Tessaracoccus sp. G1721]
MFPGCTAPPAACEAHHIVPRRDGGPSCLANGVLLCPHHRRLVEPDPLHSEKSQWQVHLAAATGLPRFTPPLHTDPHRRSRQHQRHRLQQVWPRAEAPPCPHPAADPPDPDPWAPGALLRSRAHLDALIQPSPAWPPAD